MTTDQKQAIMILMNLYNDNHIDEEQYFLLLDFIISDTKDVTPKESEDERIRKALLEYFGEECDTATINGIYCYKIYNWLEKQGAQKSILDELEMTLSVSDDAYLRENIEKLIKELKKENKL